MLSSQSQSKTFNSTSSKKIHFLNINIMKGYSKFFKIGFLDSNIHFVCLDRVVKMSFVLFKKNHTFYSVGHYIKKIDFTNNILLSL